MAVACLPLFYKIIPSPWLSTNRLIPFVIALALLSFLFAWSTVARQRCGGGRRQSWLKTLIDQLSDVLPRRTTDFVSNNSSAVSGGY